jgi:HK97 family phage major capsid protein
MNKLKELYAKRVALVKQAREVVDLADKEKRSMTAEETAKYDRIMADVDALGEEIRRLEKLEEAEKAMEGMETRKAGGKEVYLPDGKPLKVSQTAEYRKAFWDALKLGSNALMPDQVRLLFDPEVRSMVVGTDASGGYLVPDEFERTLVQKLTDENVMRQLATVIRTGGDRAIPVESSAGTAAWTSEGGNYTESDPTYTQVTLGAYKAGTIVKVSEELLADSAFDLEAYLANTFAKRIAALEEAAFVAGDGSGKPTGVVAGASAGVTGASTTAVTADEIIDLYHSLRRPYRQKAVWLMADSTAKAIRKLKTTDGIYLWQPGLARGTPDTLLDRPVYISDSVPAMAASAKSILFGDFSYYWIADRQGRVMQRLVELYAASGYVGFKMYQRVDGKLTLSEAVKYFANKAST